MGSLQEGSQREPGFLQHRYSDSTLLGLTTLFKIVNSQVSYLWCSLSPPSWVVQHRRAISSAEFPGANLRLIMLISVSVDAFRRNEHCMPAVLSLGLCHYLDSSRIDVSLSPNPDLTGRTSPKAWPNAKALGNVLLILRLLLFSSLLQPYHRERKEISVR